MEINTMKLKGKIRENQMSMASFAASIGIDSSTLFRKLSSGGDSFSIKRYLRLIFPEKRLLIFFCLKTRVNARNERPPKVSLRRP